MTPRINDYGFNYAEKYKEDGERMLRRVKDDILIPLKIKTASGDTTSQTESDNIEGNVDTYKPQSNTSTLKRKSNDFRNPTSPINQAYMTTIQKNKASNGNNGAQASSAELSNALEETDGKTDNSRLEDLINNNLPYGNHLDVSLNTSYTTDINLSSGTLDAILNGSYNKNKRFTFNYGATFSGENTNFKEGAVNAVDETSDATEEKPEEPDNKTYDIVKEAVGDDYYLMDNPEEHHSEGKHINFSGYFNGKYKTPKYTFVGGVEANYYSKDEQMFKISVGGQHNKTGIGLLVTRKMFLIMQELESRTDITFNFLDNKKNISNDQNEQSSDNLAEENTKRGFGADLDIKTNSEHNVELGAVGKYTWLLHSKNNKNALEITPYISAYDVDPNNDEGLRIKSGIVMDGRAYLGRGWNLEGNAYISDNAVILNETPTNTFMATMDAMLTKNNFTFKANAGHIATKEGGKASNVNYVSAGLEYYFNKFSIGANYTLQDYKTPGEENTSHTIIANVKYGF